MIIRKMQADFGCLEGKSLELEPGLNIIRQPNESGKSTWCAFIRAMLYGIDTTERQKSGFLPDKLRYAPWSGAPMSGSMELEYGGREITLTRSTRTASAPMREFKAVYTGTAEPVPGLTGATAGETLVGAGREVFRRSAFIGQGEAAVTGSAELERRIAAVVSTGEEGTSCSEALSRLKSWQNRRRSRSRMGALPELESALADQERQLDRVSAASERREGLLAELDRAEAEAKAQTEAEARARAEARAAAREAVDKAGEDVQRLEAAHAAAVAERARREAAAQAGPFAGMDPDEAREEAESGAAQAEELLSASRAAVSRTPAYILAALCLACIVAGFFAWYAFIGAAVFAALAVWRFMASAKAAAGAREAAAERHRLLSELGAADEAELTESAREYAELCAAADKAAGAEERAERALYEARERRKKAEARLLEEPEVSTAGSRSAALRCERLRAAIAELGGTIAATGDPMVLESGILEKRERIAELEAQYEAISLAAQTLSDADAELQSRFSPALGRRAAEYLSRMTGGRYTDVAVSRDFSVLLRRSGEAVPRQALYLSAGAADLMYLAVRLAIVDLTLPGDEPCPIVLDDALVNLDSGRREAAMELLGEIAKERQVILFTCS